MYMYDSSLLSNCIRHQEQDEEEGQIAGEQQSTAPTATEKDVLVSFPPN